MIEKWQTIKKTPAHDLKIFKAEWFERKHPKQDKTGNFIVLDSASWVNIIPITKKNELVLIEQYRHGSDIVTLEIPGGLVEKDESTCFAAMRECVEETGYQGENDAIFIGQSLPNPAFLNNVCDHYVWFGCEEKHIQKFDTHEDIEVNLVPLSEMENLVMNKNIQHSLVITAFFYYFSKFGKQILK